MIDSGNPADSKREVDLIFTQHGKVAVKNKMKLYCQKRKKKEKKEIVSELNVISFYIQ